MPTSHIPSNRVSLLILVCLFLFTCTYTHPKSDSTKIDLSNGHETPSAKDCNLAQNLLSNYISYIEKTNKLYLQIKTYVTLPGKPPQDIQNLVHNVMHFKKINDKEERLRAVNNFVNSSILYDRVIDKWPLADKEYNIPVSLELFDHKVKTGSIGFIKVKSFIAELSGFPHDEVVRIGWTGWRRS